MQVRATSTLSTERQTGVAFRSQAHNGKITVIRQSLMKPVQTRGGVVPQTSRIITKAAVTEVSKASEPDVEQIVKVLKEAASTRGVPSKLVTDAMVKLEKKRLGNDSYGKIIDGGVDGRKWQLVFTAGSKDVKKAYNKEKAGGIYCPISAAQYWKDNTYTENGIFLGQIAAFVFSGPYEYKKNKLSFDYNQIKIRLGPKWLKFDIPSQKKYDLSSQEKDRAGPGPFFIFAYADNDIIVAKGRGGGLALWVKASAEWALKNGLDL